VHQRVLERLLSAFLHGVIAGVSKNCARDTQKSESRGIVGAPDNRSRTLWCTRWAFQDQIHKVRIWYVKKCEFFILGSLDHFSFHSSNLTKFSLSPIKGSTCHCHYTTVCFIPFIYHVVDMITFSMSLMQNILHVTMGMLYFCQRYGVIWPSDYFNKAIDYLS